MSEFRMPSLGSDMEAGKLVEQAVAPGDKVRAGDVIGAVETQKGVIEIEIFQDGILDKWLAEIGATVPVGAPLAMIRYSGDRSEPAPPAPSPAPTELKPQPSEARVTPSPQAAPLPPGGPEPPPSAQDRWLPEITAVPGTRKAPPRRRITPAARRYAAARGIDLDTLDLDHGSPVTRRDLETLRPASGPAEVTTDFRGAIAAAMSRSKREIPHYYLSHDVDLTAADAFAASVNAEREPSERLLVGAICARAVVRAISKFPEFNGHYAQDEFRPSEAVHLGFAINIRASGLVAPALLDADTLSLDDLMHSMRDLTARVRAGRFRARELSDATITLTSLGERGTDAVFGVIYPPQVAIVGMGAPRMRPAVHDGTVTPRLMTTLTLAADHRISDGHRGALFLRAIDKLLQDPERL